MVMRAFLKRRYHPSPRSSQIHCMWYSFVNYDCTQYFNTRDCTSGLMLFESKPSFFYVIIITFLLINGGYVLYQLLFNK